MPQLCEWCTPLWRTFSRFPSGLAGVALLVLRVVVGVSAAVEAGYFLAGVHGTMSQVAAVAGALAGLSLVTGFMTPVVCILIAAEGAALLLAADSTALRLFDSRMAQFEFVVMATVLAILGPGAISVDARLFGLREVAISGKRRPIDP